MKPAASALKEPFWESAHPAGVERVKQRLKAKPADVVKVDPRGTVVAIVDGIVYYNTPSHREDELGV